MGYKLEGNWVAGFAFDIYTLSSKYLGKNEHGHDEYRNTYSEMGEHVHQLKYEPKYKHDPSIVNKIVNKIVDLLQTIKDFNEIDVVIPIPPSDTDRVNQPVFLIATEFGKRFNIAVYLDVLSKSKGSQELKSIKNYNKRREALRNSMRINKHYELSGKTVLLIDDIYRSGATLKVATDLLYSEEDVKNVYVLTMTKTRINR